MKIKNKLQIDLKIKPVMIGLIVVLSIFLIILFSCTTGTDNIDRSPGTPQIKIIAPVSDDVPAGDISVSVDVQNFNLVDKEGKKNSPGEGHIIYYLDVPVPTYYDHPAITKSGSYEVTANNSYKWINVTPGQHIFAVQLVNNDNMPLPLAAVDNVTIIVGAPQESPGIMIKAPEDDTELPPGIIIMIVEVDNFIISQKDMGPINRTGEGHLIYYIDEDPPTKQGQQAVTENSIVSTSLKQQWKTVLEGEHTFAVQLVNNDDTPLNPPLKAKVKLNITPGQ